ncbi:SpaA isopeptide-forming pilin-related protein [Bengtsoniella intestinalis]|uniref:MSCRAMM family protein n=1 Tax=Bengtsoniella intestinalis TaxID=3073143 RepID=UPI00391FA45B
MATQKRYMSLFLVLALVLGLFSPMTVAYAADTSGTAPTDVTVQYDNDIDWLGKYYSTNLGSNVNMRTIRSTYNYGGEFVSSYAFCLEHGDGLDEDDTYTFVEERSSYAAAPFIAFMLTGARVNGWDAATIKSVQGWVNAVVWLAEAGLFIDPTNADQIEMAAKERVAALTAAFPSTEHTLEDSIELLNMIVSGYNKGDYGSWSFYVYETDNAANQNLMIADYTLNYETYEAYVKLQKTDDDGNALSGAEFTIYEGAVAIGTITTDSSGYGISDVLQLSSATATLTVVETKAPSGYVLSGQTYTVSVDSVANATADTAAWVNGGNAIPNTPYEIPTEYVILKTDAATGEPLAGATFRLEHVNNTTTYDLVTDSSGSIQLQWLDSSADNYITPGTYTVTETSPPVGYSLSEAKVETLTFELIAVYDDDGDFDYWEQNDPGQLIYENPADNTIRFTKIDADGNVLDGGTFNVYMNGALLGQYEGGTIVLSDLKTGYYTFEEISPPSGYVMSSNPYASVYVDVTDTATDTYYLSMINYDYPDIQIRKSDPTGLGLSGAIFDVKIDGTSIGQVETNSIGVATISYAQYGAFLNGENNSWTVTVTEVQAPEGYLMSDTNVITAEIQKGQTLSTIEFVNDPIPEIQIAKIDSATGLPLAGAEFAVYIDGTQIGTYYSDEDGIVSLNYSDYGNHLDLTANSWVIKVIETAAPSGYSISDVYEQELTVVRGQTVASYTFGNYSYPQIEIYKSDEDTNRPLSGSLFKVSIDTQVLGYFSTGSDGKILISYADYYEYLGVTTDDEWTVEVEEIRAPSGYLLNANNVQSAVLNRNQGLLTFSFQNEAYPEIHIYKTDNNGNALANTLFSVSVDGTEFGQFWTDNSGMITLTHDTYGDFLGDSGADSWTVTVTEVQPTTGYLLSGTTTSTQEVLRGQAVATFTYSNYEVPEIQILKTDSSTGEPLANAEFEVFINGQSIGSFYSDADGLVLLDEANYGTTFDLSADSWLFTVTEVNPPAGYITNYETTQSVTVTAGQLVVQFNFSNYEYPEIKITKTDADTNEPLSGAVYTLAIDAQSFGSFATGEDGTVTITYADYYEYLTRDADSWTVTVEETSAPGGYLLNENDVQTAELSRNQGLLSVEYDNYAYPDILITKTDVSNGNAPIAGAIFEIYIDNASRWSLATDENGEIWITYEEYGAFLDQSRGQTEWDIRVVERSAPDGYLMDPNRSEDTHTLILGESLVEFAFVNAAYPEIVVEKRCSVTNELLEGATFMVAIDGTSLGTWTTDENGQFTISHDVYGAYLQNESNDSWTVEVTETNPPYGYHEAEIDTQTAQLKYGQELATFVFINVPKPTLTITKIDSVTREPLEGVFFDVYLDDLFIGEYETDGNGEISLVDIDPGTYTVTETRGLTGYVIDHTSRTIEVQADDGIFLYTMGFENVPESAIVITKRDAEDSSIVLQGAEFEVAYLAANSGTGGNVIGRYTTGANGSITVTGLQPGTYVITETVAPAGYELNQTSQTVYISGNNQDVVTVDFYNYKMADLVIIKQDSVTGATLSGAKFKITYSDGTVVGNSNGYYTTDANGLITISELDHNATVIVQEVTAPSGYQMDETPQTVQLSQGEAFVLTFENDPLGNLIIQKLDSVTGEALSGAVFKVTTSDGTYVANYGGTVSSNGLYTTNTYGQIHIVDLDPDTYIVTEVTAPDGYILDSTSQTVRIYEDDTQTLTFENTPIGGLTIIKTDEDDGDRIKGVEFEVRKMNGEIIGYYTTNSNGTIYLYELEAGWYQVQETEPATGYLPNDTIYTVEVEDGETTVLTVKNEKASGILIHKVDSQTGEGLYGATFLLYDSGKNPIGQYTSDQSGYVYIDEDELSAGRYYLREIDAPEGYTLDDELKTIYVSAGKTVEIEWENDPILGQIQITKYSSEDNAITGEKAGTALEGAVFEISNARSGSVVGYIVTDARGVAASEPLPLGRYLVTEVSAPAYYAASTETYEAELEYEGQIVKLTVFNGSVDLGVTIQKVGNQEVIPGDTMLYEFSQIANTSNVSLSDFYWHDRIPTDAVRAVTLTTGTYNARVSYRIVYQTNYYDYRVLASDLLSTNEYSFNLSDAVLGLMSGEYVTDIRFEFGTVPSGFASVNNPLMTVSVLPTVTNSYQITNRADIGGYYLGQWQTATTTWITITKKLTPDPELPRTGY